MNDFDYDCYIKKNIARSATKKKCGSKSKKCSLPSDSLTKKQWNERCGDIMSYRIGAPMTWKEFCNLPKDIKEEYANNLVMNYSANANDLARMFGVSTATIFRLVKNESLNIKFPRGRRSPGSGIGSFGDFLGMNSATAENNEQKHIDDVIYVETPSKDEGSNNDEVCANAVNTDKSACTSDTEIEKMCLKKFTLNFSGAINVDMIANSLRYIIGNGSNATIDIICELSQR